MVTVNLRSSRDGSLETLEVKIPAGVEDGQRIRIKGRGHPGTHSGPPGHLFLVCSVQPHSYFVRQGADVYLDVPVSVPEAVLGAKLEVPTIDGRATVTLPSGTPGGTRLRLKGRGIKKYRGEGRGDQYIIVNIVPPKTLTEEEHRQYEKLHEHDRVEPRSKVGWWKGG